ncbi:MAG: ATP-binding protein [Lachnospiraceae bacterium]|jgi:tRNA 2-thiocytidine biosynthesis protein TtcA
MELRELVKTEHCSWDQLDEVPETSYLLLDIREDDQLHYGVVPEAVHVAQSHFPVEAGGYQNDEQETARILKKIIYAASGRPVCVFCASGVRSGAAAEWLARESGLTVYNMLGGYASWVLHAFHTEEQNSPEARLERTRQIEQSIRKTFHKPILSKFTKAVRTYELVRPGDRIAVCISGGKDSMLMAKCFQELKRQNKFDFDVTYLCMDPGYNETNRHIIERNAQILGIPIVYFKSDIFDTVDKVPKSPCYLCARMRRGYLYSKAQELGCNKIALGHHYDDVIETTLMGMLYGAQIQTMMPKLHSTNFPGMELIRPMYLVREDDIKRWRDANNLHFLQCACHFTETCTTCASDGTTNSARLATKKLIRQMKKDNPFVESNIFNSMTNVNLSTVLAYKKDGVTHSFLDDYDKKESGAEDGNAKEEMSE